MIFYYAPMTVSVASHIVLEEIGAPYETRKLDFGNTEQQSPEYLAVNPKGRVPSLVTDQGIITETPAILAYLAQSFPEHKLAPKESFAFAKLQEFNCYLCATVHVAHAHKMRGKRWARDETAIAEMTANVPRTMTDCFRLIEDEMFTGPWVLGDQFTVSDAYLFTIAQWLEGDSVDINQFPRVAEHSQRMLQREAVLRVRKIHGL